MNSSICLTCLNNNRSQLVPKGASLFELIKIFHVTKEYPILGAIVNNSVKNLSYEVFHPKIILFFDITHPEGMRMYIRSICFVLCKEVHELFPKLKLRIEHTISKGIYFCVKNGHLTENKLSYIELNMRKLIKEDVPFKYIEEPTTSVIKKFRAFKFSDKADLLKYIGNLYTNYYQLGNYYDSFYGPLTLSTGFLKVFAVSKYYKGFLLQIPKVTEPSILEEKTNQVKLFEIFQEYSQWNRIQGIQNVRDLNKEIVHGQSEVTIKVCEALHENKIVKIADIITSKIENVKVIFISGPSASGKTTFSKRLSIQLLVNGIKSINLSLDNYFIDRLKTPYNKNHQRDFESIESIDYDLFNNNILKILSGNKVELCKYSFDRGKRFYNGEIVKLHPNEVIIVEGIHGLNPKMTSLIDNNSMLKIYISTLTTLNIDDHNRISTSDNRLIRRLIRDYRYRKYSAQETISRWSSVRQGEEINIFPFQEEADILFNSALNYEFAVLKPLAEQILSEILPNQSEYSEATRLLNFLKLFKTLGPTEIPPTSILREFLGGSSFLY